MLQKNALSFYFMLKTMGTLLEHFKKRPTRPAQQKKMTVDHSIGLDQQGLTTEG
jgi:hypothetical protein